MRSSSRYRHDWEVAARSQCRCAELADQFLRSIGADICEGHGEAYYVPSRDFIPMPAFEAFKGADQFYNVAFHELTHWTAHGSRLDRDWKNRFGSRKSRRRRANRRIGRPRILLGSACFRAPPPILLTLRQSKSLLRYINAPLRSGGTTHAHL